MFTTNIKYLFILLLLFKLININAQNDSSNSSYYKAAGSDTSISQNHPKIILCYTWVNEGGTSKRKMTHFYLDDDLSEKHTLGFYCKNLLPYLKYEPEAMEYYKKYKRNKIISNLSAIAAVISLLGMADAVLLEEDDEMAVSWAIVLVPPTVTSAIFGGISGKQIKIAVKIYNKNEGYGYFNGLEKKRID